MLMLMLLMMTWPQVETKVSGPHHIEGAEYMPTNIFEAVRIGYHF